jgi:proline dehydrogenase
MVDFGAVLRRLPSRDEVLGSLDQIAVAREAARPFVPGESVGSAVQAVAETMAAGMGASVLYLPVPEAQEVTSLVSMQVIDALAADDLSMGTDLAVSPRALGLGRAGPDRVRTGVGGLCRAAASAGMTVTLTSVPHELVGDLLALRAAVAEEFPDLGVTLTANLHRTEADCLDLAGRSARVRLMRREDVEAPGVAFADGHEIDKAYVRCTRMLMDGGARPVLATGDARLVEIAGALAERADRDPSDYVYQFRRGVLDARAAELVAAGASVSILVPFGPGWAAYIARWIAVRPTSLGRAVGAALGRSDS